jgi:phospholipid transport system transporter-binding protein
MSTVRLTQIAPNTLQIVGALNFNTVVEVQKQSVAWLKVKPIDTIDLAAVTHCNSAGLALLLEWLRLAKQAQRQLIYRNIPTAILSAAEVYGIKDVLQNA